MNDNVFTKMPEDVLKKFADLGVVGAKKELHNRKIATSVFSTQPMIQKRLEPCCGEADKKIQAAKINNQKNQISKYKCQPKKYVTAESYEEGNTREGWFSDEDWKMIRRRQRK